MIKKSFYKGNRRRLFSEVKDERCMILLSSGYEKNRSADESYEFQVNTNFYYLTGISQQKTYLVLLKNGAATREVLYIDPYDELYAKWCGHRITAEEASAASGVAKTDIRYTDRLEEDLPKFAKEYKTVYLDLERRDMTGYNSFGLTMEDRLRRKYAVKDIYPAIVTLRTAKQECEVEALKVAIEKTREGVEALMKNARPGMYEYQIEAHFDFAVKTGGNRPFSFRTIAAAGENATTLHYSANNCVAKDGDLILFDLGCRENGYCADITRTFPVNGKFSKMQRTIYNIVLDANKTVASRARAGMTVAELQEICIQRLTEGCLAAGLIKTREELRNYYYHNVSHSIGLDTHDPCDRQKPLPVGTVISDEPGLYFPEHRIGIRIEDDLLLTEGGAINLSASILKEADEIEAFMAKNR